MPATLKVILILAGIVVLIRLKVPLSVTLIGSAVGLGFLFRLPLPQLGHGRSGAAGSADTA